MASATRIAAGAFRVSVRLFVAVWLPAEAVATVAALDRPPSPALRWTQPGQWHVTLSFLGAVADEAVAEVASGLTRLEAEATRAVLGPATRRLGRSVLMVPVAGLDALAVAVAAVVPPGPEAGRPFVGHLTLARAKRAATVPAALSGTPMSATWAVTEVALVRSHLASTSQGAGARYETLATVPLTGA